MKQVILFNWAQSDILQPLTFNVFCTETNIEIPFYSLVLLVIGLDVSHASCNHDFVVKTIIYVK